MLFLFLIQPLFEGVEDHAVRPFNLGIGSGMGNGDVFDGDASVFAEVPKMMTSECVSKVGDDAVRETKYVDRLLSLQ